MLFKRLTILLCLFSLPLFASQCEQERTPQRTKVLVDDPDRYWDPDQVELRAKKKVYSPSAKKQAPVVFSSSPRTKGFLDIELLYWKPDQTGMTYCLLEESNTFTFLLAPKNQARQQQADWGFGFRAGGGIDIETIHMDISGYWTYFHHTMRSTTQTDHLILGTQIFFGGDFFLGGEALAAMVGTPGGPARSQWTLQLDLAEIDFGYWIRYSKWFSLHPYLGLEIGWINQQQIIHYDQFFASSSSVFFDSVITQKNTFQGVGPALGFDGTFNMGYGLGLMGKLATCFLYGSSHNPVALQVDSGSALPPLPDVSVIYKQHRLMPGLRSQIGLSWERRITEYFALFLNAAYEVQYFWETWRNQSSFIQSIAASNISYADLMLHGFTGQVRFSF